jgi:hypothetical protein
MPALAAKIAVAVAAAVVAWAGIEALRVRHVVAADLPPAAAEPAPPPASEVPKLRNVVAQEMKLEKPQPQVAAPWGVAAMARIHGRVLGGGEQGEEEEPPKITAEDSLHNYEAEVEDDGRFEINLPIGHYTLVATSGSLVAAADVAGLAEEEDREVTLVLGEGVTIEGTVHAPDSSMLDAEIEMRPSSTLATDVDVERSGQFTAQGLVPGRSYELVVTAPGMRKQIVRNVIAPRRGLDVMLEKVPVLRGGFGLAAGQECPMEAARIAASGEDEDEDPEDGVFDEACRFALHDLPDAPSVHVTAKGGGWYFEADIALPEHGDPPFLCLRKPCRDGGR